jgi:hypothetical protein
MWLKSGGVRLMLVIKLRKSSKVGACAALAEKVAVGDKVAIGANGRRGIYILNKLYLV